MCKHGGAYCDCLEYKCNAAARYVGRNDTAHARIAELEDRVQKLETCVLTLLPWAEDHEAELAPFEVKMLERARAVEKGK